MRQEDRFQDEFTSGRASGPDGWAAGPQTGGQRPPSAPRPGAGGGGRSGLGALWLLLAPLACCGGPFLIAALAAAGGLAWGGLGLGIAVLVAVAAVVLVRRRRRSRACCDPAGGWAGETGAADRRPVAR
jgi:hypothetical protein